MEKATFDSMALAEQIDHINKRLAAEAGLTVTKILQEYGKSKKQLSKYKAAGFEFMRSVNKYITSSGTEEIKKELQQETQQETQQEELEQMKEQIKEELKKELLENLQKEMQQLKNELTNSISLGNLKSDPEEISGLNISYEHFDGDIVTRSFRIYENVLGDFISFCNERKKQHKAQALLSQALLEFMENHKELIS